MLTPISPISSKILCLGLGPHYDIWIWCWGHAVQANPSRAWLTGGQQSWMERGPERKLALCKECRGSFSAPHLPHPPPTPGERAEEESAGSDNSDQSLEASSYLSVSLWGTWPICSLEQVESCFLWAPRPGMQPRAVEAMRHQTLPLWCPGGKDRTGKTSSCDSQGSPKATV